MKQYNYPFFFLLFLSLIVASCSKERMGIIESKTAVVEGYLFAGQPVDSLRITQSFSYAQEDTAILSLNDLDVYLYEEGSGAEYLLEPIGNGVYQQLNAMIHEDNSYRLEFNWNGELITAETFVPSKKEGNITTETIQMEQIQSGGFGGFGGGFNTVDPVEISWDNTEGDYYYIVIKNVEENPEYVNENIALFEDANGGRRQFSFISQPTISNFYAIDPRRELTQYGTYRIVIYRVNPEYAALYESSGSSTQSLEQPPTNVENGLGIFTGVSSDTLYLEVEKL